MQRLAFYDFDGTLVSSNVVHQYAWYVKHKKAYARLALLALSLPFLKLSDLYSRTLFNQFFYFQYVGLRRQWLESESAAMWDQLLKPKLFPKAPALLAANRRKGYLNILVTGSLDFSIRPMAEALGFDRVIANTLEFEDGTCTGHIVPPIIAGRLKVDAMMALCREYKVPPSDCRAYSDDTSDLPMLEAVGQPVAANPKAALRKIAEARGWPIEDLR